MVQEAISKGNDLWTKFKLGGWGAFSFMDLIWLAAAVVLLVIAFKVVGKVIKAVLFLAVIALIVGYVITKGFLPVFW